MIHFTISLVNLRNRKEICFLMNCVHCAVTHCMIARLCEYDNFFTYPTILALYSKKQALFNPKTHKNRRHPTIVECRLFCCPILFSAADFVFFSNYCLISTQQTPEAFACKKRNRRGRSLSCFVIWMLPFWKLFFWWMPSLRSAFWQELF